MTIKDGHVDILDTTMRDGAQSAGASMNRLAKLQIAPALEQMGVNVIEAGFPASSRDDFEAVRGVALQVKSSTVAALCRATKEDIQYGIDALAGATSSRIHTFIGASDLHMGSKLDWTREQVVERVVRAVRFARNGCAEVEFSPEDASRADQDFLCELIEAAIIAGATVINIPDTVGYAVPWMFGQQIRQLRERIPNSGSAVWSAHCHNDLGMATANSLAAILDGGVRQIECTVNGIGERAGNASLEEIVMALRTRHDFFSLDTTIDTRRIVPISQLVTQITGFSVQPNKAIVGVNAFAHTSGIHQAGVLKAPSTYEIMDPTAVGWESNRIVLSKQSGRAAVRERLKVLGIVLASEEALNEVFRGFKDLADRMTVVHDEDLRALVLGDAGNERVGIWQLKRLSQASSTETRPHASITINKEGIEHKVESGGDGPVDAVFKAIEMAVQCGAEFSDYTVHSIMRGTESQAEAMVRLSSGGRIVTGIGADPDTIIASAKAYLNAINKLEG